MLTLPELGIKAFKNAALTDPEGLFKQIRSNGDPELAYLSILFTELELEWQQQKSIPITAKKIACLSRLFFTNDFKLNLNISFNELCNSSKFMECLNIAFISASSPNAYLFNQSKADMPEVIENAIYIFDQILLAFYRDKLQELYKRYLEKIANQKNSNNLLNEKKRLSSSQQILFSPVTPRLNDLFTHQRLSTSKNFQNLLSNDIVSKIYLELIAAGFNVEKYNLPELKKYQQALNVLTQVTNQRVELEAKDKTNCCMTCSIL